MRCVRVRVWVWGVWGHRCTACVCGLEGRVCSVRGWGSRVCVRRGWVTQISVLCACVRQSHVCVLGAMWCACTGETN